MLRQTHIQILAAGAVGEAQHVDGGFIVLFQYHCHAGQSVGTSRFQVGAAAVEGDVIRHIQNDVIATTRHADARSLHFFAQFCFLHIHVIADTTTNGRTRRRANQCAFTAIFLRRRECANARADQRANTRANAGFTRFAFAGVRVCCAARNRQGAAHDGSNNKNTFLHLNSLMTFSSLPQRPWRLIMTCEHEENSREDSEICK